MDGSRLADPRRPTQYPGNERMPAPLRITDTTFRDAHQSLLATRLRIEDMEPIAARMGQPWAVLGRGVGGRDLRHHNALPCGRPVGAVAHLQEADAQYPPDDAAAWAVARGVPQLCRRRCGGVRRALRRDRNRCLPGVRRAERRAQPVSRRGGCEEGREAPPDDDLLLGLPRHQDGRSHFQP